MSPADPADTEHDLWARLRAYCEHGHALKYPPLTEEQARDQERMFGMKMTPEMREQYTSTSRGAITGFMLRPKVALFPPATEEQLHATEARLGFPLPTELRQLYTEVANGGLHLGTCYVFHGALGGCGEYADTRPDGRTIEELASHSGWRLHPRIEEALARHPGHYVIAESMPEGFVWIAEDSQISIELDSRTGCVYSSEGWGYLPDRPFEDDPRPFDLLSIQATVPSLSVWFERWMDRRRDVPPVPPFDHGKLLPELVETADLLDPEVVWRGLYRLGPEYQLQPDDTEALDESFDVDEDRPEA